MTYQDLRNKCKREFGYAVDELTKEWFENEYDITKDFMEQFVGSTPHRWLVVDCDTEKEYNDVIDCIKDIHLDEIIQKDYDDEGTLCYEFENDGWVEPLDMTPYQIKLVKEYNTKNDLIKQIIDDLVDSVI